MHIFDGKAGSVQVLKLDVHSQGEAPVLHIQQLSGRLEKGLYDFRRSADYRIASKSYEHGSIMRIEALQQPSQHKTT